MSFPPSGGTGLPAPNSLCIPQQGSVPISFGTVLEETVLSQDKEFAYQFSFLGIEYGSRFAFFTEFGVGYTGIIVAGGRYPFLTSRGRYRQCQYTDAHTLHFLERIGTSRSGGTGSQYVIYNQYMLPCKSVQHRRRQEDTVHILPPFIRGLYGSAFPYAFIRGNGRQYP